MVFYLVDWLYGHLICEGLPSNPSRVQGAGDHRVQNQQHQQTPRPPSHLHCEPLKNNTKNTIKTCISSVVIIKIYS
jgi:hypothetical protein